jgi:HD-GYP domain-containing protein (c-di-GMP phosphodiesterase class II)
VLTPLIHLPEGWAVPALDLLTAAGGVEVVRGNEPPPPALLDPTRAQLMLVPAAALEAAPLDTLTALAEVAAIVALTPDGALPSLSADREALLSGLVAAGAPQEQARLTLRAGLRQATTLLAKRRASEFDARDAGDVRDLAQARRIASADAGSIFLVVRNGDAPPTLRFKLTQNDTLPELPLTEFEMPLDSTSLAGHCAATREPFRIDDVYELDPAVPYRFNRSFDERTGYRTKSILVIPMQTHLNEVVGVVQLINQKRHADARLATTEDITREVIPFDLRSVEMVEALASQAGVAIENSRLSEDIERLFEGFVTAAVTAIESRDPTTSGHSWRVATLTCTLAEAVDRGGTGAYRDTRFTREQLRELRYAGLLHDFGKVGVREQVLVKQKKLYPGDLALVKHRFQFLLQRADLQFERERAEFLLEHGRERYEEALGRMHADRRAERERLHRFLDAIIQANEPTVLPEGTFEELREINAHTFVDFDGTERPLLGDEELRFLMINRGNLDASERREIESHVTHTYRFLEQIPWTTALRGIPSIAYGHHEKLNGAGYPRQLTGDAIPVQTRMMTIADIYDALTATDRPYKRAVPLDRAIRILRDEAAEGALDASLLETFVDARVFESVQHDVAQRRSGAGSSHR